MSIKKIISHILEPFKVKTASKIISIEFELKMLTGI